VSSALARPKQETPAARVADVMRMIRGQWYADLPEKKWFQDEAFVMRNVVLWPASWLNKRGLTLPPERYFAIIIDKLNDVKRNTAQATLKSPAGYLMRCLQDHFAHNEDAIHDEAKNFSAKVNLALSRATAAPVADHVARMGEAYEIAALGRKRKLPTPGPLVIYALLVFLAEEQRMLEIAAATPVQKELFA
jgi:hypothetical protein